MPEVATVTDVTQIGFETTPGTLVAATRKLGGAQIKMGPEVEFDEFGPEGVKSDTLITPVMEHSVGDIEGRPCYNELTYFLAAAVANPAAPTQIMDGATPTGGYTWTWVPAISAEDTRKTLSIERGNSVRAQNYAYGLVPELSISLARDSAPELGGTAFAQRMTDPGVLTTIASPITPVPILITHVDVYMDTTAGAYGTTKLTRLFSADWSIADMMSPVWVIDSTKPSFVAHVENKYGIELSTVVEADTQGMGVFTPLRAGDTRFFQIKATGPNIYTGGVTVNHSLTINCPMKVKDVGDFDEVEGVKVIEYTWGGVYHPAGPNWLAITLVNMLASL